MHENATFLCTDLDVPQPLLMSLCKKSLKLQEAVVRKLPILFQIECLPPF